MRKPDNQPAGIDAVDAVVNGRPADSRSTVVLKAGELWQGLNGGKSHVWYFVMEKETGGF